MAGSLVVTGAALAPLIVPLLPEETLVRYQAALGWRERTRTLGARPADDFWAMPHERGRSVWICRGLGRPLSELWPLARHYE